MINTVNVSHIYSLEKKHTNRGHPVSFPEHMEGGDKDRKSE